MKLPARSGDFAVTVAVRLMVAAFGLAALLVPLPGFTTPSAVLAVFALPLPIVVALRPDSGWVAALLSIAVAEWVITSLFEGTSPAALTVAFGILLYLLHASASFAAALPVTRRVEPGLLIHAVVRLLAVIAVSLLLMVLALSAPSRPGSIGLAAAGSVGAMGVVTLLVVLLRRRPAD